MARKTTGDMSDPDDPTDVNDVKLTMRDRVVHALGVLPTAKTHQDLRRGGYRSEDDGTTYSMGDGPAKKTMKAYDEYTAAQKKNKLAKP